MTTNLQRLNSAILANEQLQQEFNEYKEKSEKQIQLLYNENKVLKAEFAHLKSSENSINERLDRLESQLGVVYVDADTEQNMDVDKEVASGEATGAGAPEGGEKALESSEDKASQAALKSKTFKDMVLEAFRQQMGVKKLDGSSLPGYPMGIGEGTEAWPKDKATGKSLVRFDWREKKHDDPVNVDGLATVVNHIKTVAETIPTRKMCIKKILPGEVEKAVRTKYLRLASEYRKAEKKRKRADEDDEFRDEVEVVETSLDRAHMNSRVQSKLDARKRKRTSEECDPKWKDGKYDTAFILNAMSDDDDDPNHIPGEPVAFITMEPEWRNPQVSELFSAIDALKDPRPDQVKLAKTRKRLSEKKVGAPPLAKTLATRVRTWMVKPELLQQNPDWFTTGRVASSGGVWGEEEPKELTKDRKGKGKAMEAGPSTKSLKIILPKRKVGDDAESSKAVMEAAQQKINELLGGRSDADDLFG